MSIRYSERLAEAGIEPSVGSCGDSYKCAACPRGTTRSPRPSMGRADPSSRTVEDQGGVKLATLEWVAWFNTQRPREPIGYIPSAEAEANYYRQLAEQTSQAAAEMA